MSDAGYLAGVDGLRALAVLAVMFYHAQLPGFAGGYLGVDVFLVISGYLITGLLWRELLRSGKLNMRHFYERRIRRLLPSLALVVSASLMLGLVFLSPVGGEQQGLAKSAIAAALMLSNVYFMLSTGDYFDGPAESQVLLHTWSLSVEEQFYLVWPLLLVGLYLWFRRSGLQVVHLVLVGITLASLLAWWWLPPELSFYLMPTRAWEFAVGALVFFACAKRTPSARVAGWCSWIGLGLICLAFGAPVVATAGLGNLLAVVGSAMVLAVVGGPVLGAHRLLGWGPLVQVGKWSYGMYLWHWPLLAVGRIHSLDESGLVDRCGLLVLSVVLAALSYQYVEHPIRTRRYPLMANRQRTFGVGLALSVGLLGMSVALGAWAKRVQVVESARSPLIAAVHDIRRVDVACVQERPYVGVLNPRVNCLRGNGPVKLVLWGDSHAAHLVPMLDDDAQRQGFSYLVRFMPECPPAPEFDTNIVGIGAGSGCIAFNQDVLAEVRSMAVSGPIGVVLGARWSGYAGRPPTLGRQLSDAVGVALSDLASLQVRVVLMAPGVDLPHRAPLCLVRRPVSACGIDRSEMESQRAELLGQFAALAARHANVRLYDALPALCGDETCSPVLDRVVLYSDAHHLSVAGARHLLASAAPSLDWATGVPQASTRE